MRVVSIVPLPPRTSAWPETFCADIDATGVLEPAIPTTANFEDSVEFPPRARSSEFIIGVINPF